MPTKAEIVKLKHTVKFTFNRDEGIKRRKHNVEEFYKIPRDYQNKPLVALEKEAQILVATTEWGEKIYHKYPGLESLRTGKANYPFDFRPAVPKSENTHCSLKDMAITDFCNTLVILANRYPELLEILIALMMKVAYSDFPLQTINTNLEIISPNQELVNIYKKDKKMSPLYHHHYTLEDKIPYVISLHLVDFPSDIWKILNKISLDGTAFEGYSFELYIRYFDAVLQCEDCKMTYQNKNGLYQTQKRKFDYDIGRVNTVRSVMLSLACEKGLIHSTILEQILQDISRKAGMRPIPLFAAQQLAPNLIHIPNEDVQRDLNKYKKKSTATVPLKDGIYEFYKKELPNLHAKIEVKNKKCILLAKSIVADSYNDGISIKAKQNRACILLDDEGVVLEDFYLSDFTLPIVSQVICGKKITKPEKYFVKVDDDN